MSFFSVFWNTSGPENENENFSCMSTGFVRLTDLEDQTPNRRVEQVKHL